MDIKHIKKSKLISIVITFILFIGLTVGVFNMTKLMTKNTIWVTGAEGRLGRPQPRYGHPACQREDHPDVDR